jgi:hypothetical protein
MTGTTSAVTSRVDRPFDPDYWSQRFSSEPYLEQGDRFQDFEPAYRFGHSLYGEIDDFDLRIEECERLWEQEKMESKLTWARAKNAARAAWQHAGAAAESKSREGVCRAEKQLREAARMAEDTICKACAEMKENVRKYPGEYLFGTVATGYIAGRVPLRLLARTGIGVAAAAAPVALVLWGLYKAVNHFQGLETDARSLPGRRAARKGMGDSGFEG